MRIDLVDSGSRPRGIELLKLSHGEESIVWPVPGYKPAGIPHREMLFDPVNKLLERLNGDDQAKLWRTYKEIRSTLDQITDSTYMYSELTRLSTEIYEVITYALVRNFVYVSGEIQLPPNLKHDYGDGDIVERTYLKDDYVDLVILALGLRFMVPIWGEYIVMITGRTGSEFKEKSAYDLIKRSEIYKWRSMERLANYVEATITDVDSSLSTLIGGLSSVEIPKYMLALVTIRKLAVGPLSAYTKEDNLISIVYNFVDGNSKRLDVRFTGTIAPKKPVRESADDDNSSVWDMYKINQGVSDGDKMLIEVYTENLEAMANRIHPEYEDPTRLDQCVSVLCGMHDLDIEYHHLVFTQWVMARAIPPKGIQSLGKVAMLRCMALTQSVLWDWGFYELALLMGASRVRADDSDMFIGSDGRSRVSKDYHEKLNELYPFYRRRTRKVDPNKRDNIAVRAIDTVCDTFIRDEWRINAPDALMSAHGHTSVTRVMTPSADIKNQMAQLIIRLNQR